MFEANRTIGHLTSKNPLLTAFSTLDRGPVHDPQAAKPAISAIPEEPNHPETRDAEPFRGGPGENKPVDLARIAWLVVVVACLIAVVVLVIEGYVGYALVTLAVAASAGLNLT
jgi:hypothetical protein